MDKVILFLQNTLASLTKVGAWFKTHPNAFFFALGFFLGFVFGVIL
jgi:hypothetical protein